jgi:hypothetical protein
VVRAACRSTPVSGVQRAQPLATHPPDDTRDFLRALLVVAGLMTWVAVTVGVLLFQLVR